MARIFYSMAGEGRGHAARVRSMVEHLRGAHELLLLAPDDAYEFLEPQYRRTDGVRVLRIPGMKFQYTRGRLDLWRSIAGGLAHLWRLPGIVDHLRGLLRRERPDLAIADFEPALPRAARDCGVPLLTLDHQNFLLTYDLQSLPVKLRHHAWLMGHVVRAHAAWQAESIVSAFFRPPLRAGVDRVTQVGPLLRPEVTSRRPTAGEFVLSYLRPQTPPRVAAMLAELPCPVRVYGMGVRPPERNLTFHAIDQERFVDDLAACRGYIGAAGNQTLGEALHFGKPVLALPEHAHHEQRINAHFIEQMRVGRWRSLERVKPLDLTRFLADRAEFAPGLAAVAGRIDGTRAAVAAVHRHLPRAAPSTPSDEPRDLALSAGQ